MNNWPTGYGRHFFATVDSTNEQARLHAAAGASLPAWFVAERQTSARGRQGRVWHSPAGNLAMTLAMQDTRSPSETARLGFLAALAVADVLDELLPDALTRLKWPNDVLVNDRKASGILIEREGATTGPALVLVGIGINLAAHPPADQTRWAATSVVGEGGAPVAPADAACRVANRFAHWMSLEHKSGFLALRQAWRSRATRIGEPIEVRLPSETLAGVFEDLAEDGSLVLATGTGTRRIAAGDVFFPEAR